SDAIGSYRARPTEASTKRIGRSANHGASLLTKRVGVNDDGAMVAWPWPLEDLVDETPGRAAAHDEPGDSSDCHSSGCRWRARSGYQNDQVIRARVHGMPVRTLTTTKRSTELQERTARRTAARSTM